ncbi:hypothetical protein [Bacillus sp. AK128]
MDINYEEVYRSLKAYLCKKNPVKTKDITKDIKDFFNIEENNNLGIFSRSRTEYLTDVHITSFSPLEVVEKKSQRSNNKEILAIKPGTTIKSYLAVESELGGSGASSAYGIMQNVVEDFCKLLLINSDYKMLVFTSLKYSEEDENEYIKNRVKTLKDIYVKSSPRENEKGLLLVHIKGTRAKSTQVQVEVSDKNISGFLINCNHVMMIDG